MLDPRVSYEGLKIDYGNDIILFNHLEDSKRSLFEYFDKNYPMHSPTPLTPPSIPVQALPADGSPQKSFMAWYRRKEKYSTNKLEEYFKLSAEDFKTCNPIQWWVGQRAQFPHLFQLARDILCISGEYFGNFNSCNSNLNCLTGSAVAVERIFSSGWDTISLRHASLQADTIRILMLVKKHLHLAHTRRC